MTPPPRSAPRFSFRNVPPAIYVALGIGLAGALVVAIAVLRSSGELYERFQAIERWRLLDVGCDVAATILLALGLLELAKRYTGARRTLAQVAAGLGLASLGWLAVQPLIAIAEPSSDNWRAIYDWLGRGIGVLLLAGAVVLTLAADAWRRAPVAAAGLVVIGATGYWVPVLGKAISELVGPDLSSRQLYGLVRIVVFSAATLFVIAALAAGGRDPAPDPRAAASGLRLARGALIFRIVAAIAIAMLVVAGRSRDAAQLIAIAGPAVVVVAMIAFAIALQRIASARIDGMPRLLLSIGAALSLWWAAIQFEQATALLDALGEQFGADRLLEVMGWFSVAGPIAAVVGLALVGTAIASFAGHRGDLELRRAATGRTATFLALALAGIAIPLLATKATSVGGAVAVLLFSAIATVLGLLALAALLRQASESLDAAPGIPPARIV